jgi:hypothetical protein
MHKFPGQKATAQGLVFGSTVFLSALVTPIAYSDELALSLTDAINDGKFLLHTHTRAEAVDDSATNNKDASAITHRTYLGYETGKINHFSARIAFENIVHLMDDFSVPGETPRGFDVVADPEGTEVEEAFITYTGFDKTAIKVGRQYLTYRPAPLHRFIGTVPWRQNWQSMDAISIENKSIDNLTINYAYVDNVNRIFGEDNPNRDLADSPMSSHLVNLQYEGSPIGSIEGFYYHLDYDKDTLAGPFTDRSTLGVKIQGKRDISDTLGFTYLGEVSHQRAIKDNQTSFDSANQYRVELGVNSKTDFDLVKKPGIKFGYEVLESDGGLSFATPLATVHAFQGWADRFIGFPNAGVQDLYVAASGTLIGGIKLVAIFHDFSTDAGNSDYGQEFDFQATKKFGKWALSFKHANYMGSNEAAVGAIGRDKTVSWFFADFTL